MWIIEIIEIYKDLPLQIIRKRQEYKFLTMLLQKNEIFYRWDKIEGIIFNYRQRRYKLNSIEQAKFFFEKFNRENREREEGNCERQKREEKGSREEESLNREKGNTDEGGGEEGVK